VWYLVGSCVLWFIGTLPDRPIVLYRLKYEVALQRGLAYLSRCNLGWFCHTGKFPLVLDLVVAEVKLTRVLIDGVSGLNLIFASTLRKMGLDLTDMLVPSKSPFYGIVPGNAAHPLGTMVLPVTFGTRENYRTEFIKFEVANFESSYHCILGRPALAKFMVVPHYIYLLLKMPG
jgi:hypothetical protein